MTTDTTPEARPLDEQYDTQMDVERNPCGAWQAIQTLAAENAALRTENDRLRGALAIYRDAVLQYAGEGMLSDCAYDWLNDDAGKVASAALDAKP